MDIKTDDSGRDGNYIRIRVILLGEIASSFILENISSNVSFYKITQKKEIQIHELKVYCHDADIVLLVSDLNDNFATENICTIIDMLYQKKVLYSTILSNHKVLLNRKGVSASNELIVENQEDSMIKTEFSASKEMNKIISSLCQLIDNEIITYRALGDDFSPLITLQSFFEDKGMLQLYVHSDYYDFEKVLEDSAILRSNVEQASKVWVKFGSREHLLKDARDFMGILESTIDEDADMYFNSGNEVKSNEVILLLKYNE